MTLKYSVENTFVVTGGDDRGRDRRGFGRSRGVRDITIVATVLCLCLNTLWCVNLKHTKIAAATELSVLD